jgi:single-stranded-DNA-specific exonuclease
MFLCQPLLEVLAGRGIEDIDAFLQVPTWNDLPDPFLIPSMEKATARVLGAIRNRERITIFWRLRLRWGPRSPHLTQRA